MDGYLSVVDGDSSLPNLPFRLPATIGRGRGASILIPHPLISRVHCKIYARNGVIYVRDLGSLNGTFVDQQQVDGEMALGPDCRLTLGTLTFEIIFDQARVASADRHNTRTVERDRTHHDTDAELLSANEGAADRQSSPEVASSIS